MAVKMVFDSTIITIEGFEEVTTAKVVPFEG